MGGQADDERLFAILAIAMVLVMLIASRSCLAPLPPGFVGPPESLYRPGGERG
jgi:hypothetical protein